MQLPLFLTPSQIPFTAGRVLEFNLFFSLKESVLLLSFFSSPLCRLLPMAESSSSRRVSFGSPDVKLFSSTAAPSTVSSSAPSLLPTGGMSNQDQLAMMMQTMASMGANPPPISQAETQQQQMSGMSMSEAQKYFLDQASKAKSANNNHWGPGGVGGISTQGIQKPDQPEIVLMSKDDNDDPYASIDDDDRVLKVRTSPSKLPSGASEKGGNYGLMEAAGVKGVEMIGDADHGRGLSEREYAEMSKRFNEADAMEKYLFACDKVRGGYILSERKGRLRKREISLRMDREDREEREREIGLPDEVFSLEKARLREREIKMRREKEEREEREAGRLDDEDENAYVDVQVPDSRDPTKKRTVRDRKARMLRRETRKAQAALRTHRIIEMDPNSIAELRESIRKRREDAKRARKEKLDSNQAAEDSLLLQGAPSTAASTVTSDMKKKYNGDNTGVGADADVNLPKPPRTGPPALIPRKVQDGAMHSSMLVKSLLSKHRAVVQAVEQTLDVDVHVKPRVNPEEKLDTDYTDQSQKKRFNHSHSDYVMPPPPPQTYSGVEADGSKDEDTGVPNEWRSRSRQQDIKKVHDESQKITHASTLVDVLDTISDLRDDIEKLKRDRRKIMSNLKKIDGQFRKTEGHESQKEVVAVRERLLAAKNTTGDQIEEMEEMLAKLQDSRKRLMERRYQKPTPPNIDSAQTSDTSDSEGDAIGGMDGLKQRRRKRKEKREKKKSELASTEDLKAMGEQSGRPELANLWKKTETTSLASGASAAIQTNDDGCPLYYKLLLDINHPKDVSAQQRETYEFIKQSSVSEQVNFLSFALDPSHAKDLLPIASAFLKLHAHSYKSLRRFRREIGFQNPHLLQTLCCAVEHYHVEYLSPVLALLWLFAKVKVNRGLLIQRGVVGMSIKRLNRYADLMKRKGLDKRKGVGIGMDVGQQTLCSLTLLVGVLFENG